MTRLSEPEQTLLRRTFRLATEARERGDLPFGALLAVGDRAVAEARNEVITTRDFTAHAELALVRSISNPGRADLLATATVYASSEPCPMCMGALFWTGARRVVFGMSTRRLRRIQPELSPGAGSVGFALSAREIGSSATPPLEVLGPFLEDEAAVPHQEFWA